MADRAPALLEDERTGNQGATEQPSLRQRTNGIGGRRGTPNTGGISLLESAQKIFGAAGGGLGEISFLEGVEQFEEDWQRNNEAEGGAVGSESGVSLQHESDSLCSISSQHKLSVEQSSSADGVEGGREKAGSVSESSLKMKGKGNGKRRQSVNWSPELPSDSEDGKNDTIKKSDTVKKVAAKADDDAVERLRREKAEAYARTLREENTAVYEAQMALLEGPTIEQRLQAATRLLSKSEYDDVVEERSIAGVCGYPLCEKPLQPVSKRKGRYRISLAHKRVFDTSETLRFCSLDHVVESGGFRVSLGDERPLLPTGHELHAAVDAVKGHARGGVETGDDVSDLLPTEEGSSASPAVMSAKLVERSPNDVSADVTVPKPGRSDAIEGYVPKTGGRQTAQNGKLKKKGVECPPVQGLGAQAKRETREEGKRVRGSREGVYKEGESREAGVREEGTREESFKEEGSGRGETREEKNREGESREGETGVRGTREAGIRQRETEQGESEKGGTRDGSSDVNTRATGLSQQEDDRQEFKSEHVRSGSLKVEKLVSSAEEGAAADWSRRLDVSAAEAGIGVTRYTEGGKESRDVGSSDSRTPVPLDTSARTEATSSKRLSPLERSEKNDDGTGSEVGCKAATEGVETSADGQARGGSTDSTCETGRSPPESGLRLQSAQAVASALAEAAARVQSGELDESEAMGFLGMTVQPANEGPPRGKKTADVSSEATGICGVENEGLSKETPAEESSVKKGYVTGGVLERDDGNAGPSDGASVTAEEEEDDPGRGWMGAPPKGFTAELSQFGTLWIALDSWLSADTLRFLDTGMADQLSAGPDESVSVAGREYRPKTGLENGASAAIGRAFQECVRRAFPDVQRAMRIKAPRPELEDALGKLARTFSFTDALPSLKSSGWRLVTVLLLHALSVQRMPVLRESFKDRAVFEKLLVSCNSSRSEYPLLIEKVVPTGGIDVRD